MTQPADEPLLSPLVSSADDTPVGGVVVPQWRRRIRVPRWWRRGGWRRVVGSALCVLLLGVVYYAVSLFQVWSTGRDQEDRVVDAIVVMGAAQYDGRPSPQLQARLDHVVALWSTGIARVVIVTGGNQPGDRFTEAQASRRYLVNKGVPEAVILAEDTGRSSWESITNVADRASVWGVGSVLIVSDPYHCLRARLMAEELGLTAYVSATSTSPVKGWTAARKHLAEAAGVAVGRIVGFGTLESWIG